jgi:Domain of unknown function (DUF4405)
MRRLIPKFCLDLFLLLTFIVLVSPKLSGIPVHEWLGILIGLPVLFHLLYSWSWITNNGKRLLKADGRTRVNFFLNIVLFILIAIQIVSGVVISMVILPVIGIRTIDDYAWRTLHNMTSTWLLYVVGLHLSINWKWIYNTGRRFWNNLSLNKSIAGLGKSLINIVWRSFLIFLAFGIVAAASFAFLGRPTRARIYVENAFVRFSPTIGHGLFQFLGESMILGITVYIGYRWLRMHL